MTTLCSDDAEDDGSGDGKDSEVARGTAVVPCTYCVLAALLNASFVRAPWLYETESLLVKLHEVVWI